MNLELLYRDSEAQNKKIDTLLATVRQDGENIRTLARIAEIHERRITELEDGSDDVQ